jgi:hypothetical protein
VSGPSCPTKSLVRYQPSEERPAATSPRGKFPPPMAQKENKIDLTSLPCWTADADTTADYAMPKAPPNMHPSQVPVPDLSAPQLPKQQLDSECLQLKEASDRALAPARLANEHSKRETVSNNLMCMIDLQDTQWTLCCTGGAAVCTQPALRKLPFQPDGERTVCTREGRASIIALRCGAPGPNP